MEEITGSIDSKIENINNSLECVRDELYKIQLYSGILNEFSEKYEKELSFEFKEIIGKILKSIQIVNDKSYMLEINKLKKIIKTKSGKLIELTNPSISCENNNLNNLDNLNNFDYLNNLDNSNNLDNLDDESEEINDNLLFDLSKDTLGRIDFNVNIYTSKKILSKIALDIFTGILDLPGLKINYDSLKEFIHQVSLYYHNNPYHNFKHAISVLQFTYLLLIKTNASKFLSQYEIFGLMVASFVHDIDHPGHTNFFEINIKSHLALKYNDNSVLENHHCSLAFYLIHSKNIQLFKNLDEGDFAIIRETIIECVLSTDMKHHNDLVLSLGNKFCSGWNWESKIDRLLFLKTLIHTADLSNQVRPFDVSKEGSLALRREFSVQIEKEQKLNLPSLDFMKLNDDRSFYSSEHFFSQNTVKPLWNVLVEMFPILNEYYEHLDLNINKWKELLNGVSI